VTRLVVLAILVALGVGGIIISAAVSRVLSSLTFLVGVLVGVWFATAAAYYSDYRNADDYFVCWPDCTTFQDANGTILVGFPVVLAAWLLAAVLISRGRARSSSE
jgi:K+-sensing histidine kinase KdpD